MDNDVIVWPDAQRGIHSLLEGREILGFTLQPEATPDRLDFEDAQKVVVQLETVDTREGDIDRVQEIRLTVYGPTVYVSRDIYEQILSLISGIDIDSPALHNWPVFYFDEIRRGQGPSSPSYSDKNYSPATGTVFVTARPMA